MSDWVALRQQLLRDYPVIKDEEDLLRLGLKLDSGTWYVRLQRPDGDALEIAVVVRPAAGVPPLALAAVNDNVAPARLGIANQYVILRHAVPIAGLDYSALREAIEGLIAKAERVARALRPEDAIFALYAHLAQ